MLAPLGDLSRTGLEIGALHHPIVDRADANVLYVDHADTATLHAKYEDHAEVETTVEVDVVWGDGDLVGALGDRGPVDWVIASHVIEHVPNLVGWLDQLAEVMADGAVLTLAIPDKRYCFDVNRRETDPADVVAAWLADSKRASIATIYEFYARIIAVDAGQAWAGLYDLQPAEDDVARGLEWARKAAEADEYIDVHCWAFTPSSFLATLRTLFRLGLTSFRVASFTPTLPNELEFFCALERMPSDGLAPQDRIEAQLASLPPDAADGNRPADAARAMVLSAREARVVEAKRRAVGAVRRVLGKSWRAP